MDTLVRGNADELNQSLIEFIKTAFKGKKVAVHIYEDSDLDETEYLLSDPINKENLLQSIAEIKQGKELKEYTMEQLKKQFSHV